MTTELTRTAAVLIPTPVVAQGTPDMTVAVPASKIVDGNVTADVAAGNVTITTADATQDRMDAVVADSSGTKSVLAGTVEDGVNAAPPDTTGYAVLAYVYVYSQAHPAYDGTITDEVIEQVTTFDNPTDVQTFTADGTWTPPGWATTCRVVCIGAGGGGGGGFAGATGSGGGGGGGGACLERTWAISELTTPVAIAVPAGGVGGASNADGLETADDRAAFGTYLNAGSGGGGSRGRSSANAGGGGGGGGTGQGNSVVNSANHGAGGGPMGGGMNANPSVDGGGAGGGSGGGDDVGFATGGSSTSGGGGGAMGLSGSAGSDGGGSVFGAGAGGSGGGNGTGGDGGISGGSDAIGGGAAGGNPGTPGSAIGGVGGGGGGGTSTAGTGAAGGLGGSYGGGGGGGGRGSSTGGHGGAGGPGIVIVFAW